MRIAFLGGTGELGEALALRVGAATHHDLLVGSRDPERARAAAATYETTLSKRGFDRSVGGFVNAMAADRARVVVLCVPAYAVAETVEDVADRIDEDTVLVTPATSTRRDDDGTHYRPPSAGSVTRLVANAAPAGVPVVGAFHGLPVGRLADLDVDVTVDTLLVGDDRSAKESVADVVGEVDGLRPLDAGGIANAAEVESLAPMLRNVAANDRDVADPGIRLQ
jgi:hypothetical protein